MKVAKWGNSLAVRLPKAIVDVMGLREGDDVQLALTRDPDYDAEAKAERLKWLKAMRRKYGGRLPADYKFDRQDAIRRGY